MHKSIIPPPGAWFILALAAAGRAAPLDLPTALRLADENAFGNRMAASRVEAASGQNLSAWAGFAPRARLEVGVLATDDPLGAFGTRLGQRRVSMASFDPAVLNSPSVITGVSTALVAEVPLVNLDAWHGKKAAKRNLEAAERGRELERDRIRAQVVEAWFAVGLARAAVGAWESGLEVARSYESQAVSGMRNETATRSDLLRARVEVASIGASLAEARTDVALAEQHLALLLGGGPLAGTVPAIELADEVLESRSGDRDARPNTAEVEVVGLQAQAARSAWSRARAAQLPRVNGMARVDWKEHESMFEEDPSWTVGVVATWTLVDAGALGEARQARGRMREAETGREALRARQAMEREAEQAKLKAALERLEIERGSLEQTLEAHRITSRRYEEGLATIAERIEAGALETRIRLEMVASRQEVVSSLAKLSLLEGRDPAELVSLVPKN